MSGIPDRWIPYKACGNVIEGTRLICFKVPLKKSIQNGARDIKEKWDIAALLKKVPNLGGVVDLTNTARYYNPAELQAAGVVHKKILMPGRIIPPENKVTEFMDAIDELLKKDGESLIGVHCTHGLNRTGYMVCRYMRDRLGVAAKDAIKKFEKARGYQIERQNFIADLLGTIPPEPDVGKDTDIKPFSRQHSRSTNSRSPLQPEEDTNWRQRDRYNRCNGGCTDRCYQCNKHNSKYNHKNSNRRFDNESRSNNDNSRKNNWRDRSESNWRQRENNGRHENNRRDSNRSDVSRNSANSSGSSYDFRYDY